MDQERLENLVLAVCEVVPPEHLSTTKLNKLLWLIDKTAFMTFGRTITGCSYLRKARGPVPQGNKDIFRQMEANGALECIRDMHRAPSASLQSVNYHGRISANNEVFSPEERGVISDILQQYGNKSTRELVDLSHDLAWATYEDGEEIPFAAYLSSIQNENELDSVRRIIDKAESEYLECDE